MREVLDLPGLVGRFKGSDLSVIERILVVNDGTVQTTLSVIFNEPVNVRVLMQQERAGRIERDVALWVDNGRGADLGVCKASTVIQTGENAGSVLFEVREQKLGLGQIIEKLGFTVTRQLGDYGSDETRLWRTYVLSGERRVEPGPRTERLRFTITETFLREMFR